MSNKEIVRKDETALEVENSDANISVIFEDGHKSTEEMIRPYKIFNDNEKIGSGDIAVTDEQEARVAWFEIDEEFQKQGFGKKGFNSLIKGLLREYPTLDFIEGTTTSKSMLMIVGQAELPLNWHSKYNLESDLNEETTDVNEAVDHLDTLTKDNRRTSVIFVLEKSE